MFEIGKTFKFEAAHRLAHHDGKCSRPHGHSYEFELIVEGRTLALTGTKAGMVVDYDQVTEVGKWIEDQFDHRDLNEVLDSDTTTAEELSKLVFDMASSKLPGLAEVRFKETAKTFASYRPARLAQKRAEEIGQAVVARVRKRLYRGIDTTNSLACWPFAGSKDPGGYGWFQERVAGPTARKAHRISAWLDGADIEGAEVLHSCDNPACVNPAHLFTGTHADNEADKDAKGRRPLGEESGRAKLQAAQVMEIRTSPETRRSLAARFGVSTSLINAIIQRRVWRHLP